MVRLSEKVVIITRDESGIGASTAKLFAKEGGKVVLADLNEDGVKKKWLKLKLQEGW